MAITHVTSVRNAIADLINSLINTGAGTAKLRIRAGATTIVDFELPNPAFGAAAGGVISGQGLPISSQAVASGNIDNFQILDRDDAPVFSGTITATGGGGDIIVSNINVAADQDTILDSLSYTAPL